MRAKVRNLYNQAPHLTHDTNGKVTTSQLDITNESQEVGPFQLGDNTSLQCYSVLSDILVKNELCIPLERGSNVLSTGEGFICLSPPSKLKIAVRFCFIYKKTILFSAIVF